MLRVFKVLLLCVVHMARRLRRRGYRRRVFRRFRRRGYRRRGSARRAAGQQKQRFRFVIKSSFYGNVLISPVGNVGSQNVLPNFAGSASISVYQNLLKSNYFQNLIKMFDQFKLDSCKIKITPTQSVLLQGAKQSIFVSAWDRNGINDATSVPSFGEIASYSSAFQKAINLDAMTWSASRKIYASSIQEKSLFIPTGICYGNPAANNANTSGMDIFNGQFWQIPWNPQLLIGVMSSASYMQAGNDNAPEELRQRQFANTQTWNFLAQMEWIVSFRGLRYDSPASAPLVNLVSTINATAGVGVGNFATQPDGQSETITEIPTVPVQPTIYRPNATTVLGESGSRTYKFLNPRIQTEELNVISRQYIPVWTSNTNFTTPYYRFLSVNDTYNITQPAQLYTVDFWLVVDVTTDRFNPTIYEIQKGAQQIVGKGVGTIIVKLGSFRFQNSSLFPYWYYPWSIAIPVYTERDQYLETGWATSYNTGDSSSAVISYKFLTGPRRNTVDALYYAYDSNGQSFTQILWPYAAPSSVQSDVPNSETLEIVDPDEPIEEEDLETDN